MMTFALTAGTTVGSGVIDAFTTGLGSLGETVTTAIAGLAAIAIPIAGTVWIAKRAMGWFKGMAK